MPESVNAVHGDMVRVLLDNSYGNLVGHRTEVSVGTACPEKVQTLALIEQKLYSNAVVLVSEMMKALGFRKGNGTGSYYGFRGGTKFRRQGMYFTCSQFNIGMAISYSAKCTKQILPHLNYNKKDVEGTNAKRMKATVLMGYMAIGPQADYFEGLFGLGFGIQPCGRR